MKSYILVFFLISISVARADMFAPSHSCSKPHKPFEFTSQYEIESYKSDLQNYRYCIEGFVEEQKEAISNHQEAIEDATTEYNNFVRYQ